MMLQLTCLQLVSKLEIVTSFSYIKRGSQCMYFCSYLNTTNNICALNEVIGLQLWQLCARSCEVHRDVLTDGSPF